MDEFGRLEPPPQSGMYLSGASVVECEGKAAGILDCVLMDPESHAISYLIVRRGTLLGHNVYIPAGWIQEIHDGRIILKTTQDALANLERFFTHHDAATRAQYEEAV